MSNGGRGVVRPVVMALCIGVTIAGLLNVYGDNAEVQARAEAVACGKPGCGAALTRMERTPLAQSYTFQTRANGSVSVECKREFFLVGDYTCTTATSH